MSRPRSIFERIFVEPRHPWGKIGLILLLFLAPMGAAIADGSLSALFQEGRWRAILQPPVVITYIILVSPGMSRLGNEVTRSLRALVIADPEKMDQLLDQMKPSHRKETIMFCLGTLFGLLMASFNTEGSFTWLALIWILTSGMMYGLLAWIIYSSLASSRWTATMLRQPLKVDPFNTSPFEPIGRQSLMLSLVFVGGIVASMLFAGFPIETVKHPAFWLINIPIILVPVAIFFISMHPTHKVLTQARDRELEIVQEHFERSCREMVHRLDRHEDTSHLSAEIIALETYSRRLQTARTWPYNTPMLRILFFSVLIPSGTELVGMFFQFF